MNISFLNYISPDFIKIMVLHRDSINTLNLQVQL